MLVVMKGTGKGCGVVGVRWCCKRDEGYQQRVWSSADGVIGMKGAVKGCGSCIDGVMGRVMGMKGTVKG